MSDDVKPRRRRYHSPGRRRQAAATRTAILEAARRLFAERGYEATTIAAVAEAAGVAVQTVYLVFGSKRAILSALVDLVKEQADIAPTYARLMAEADPRRQLRLAVRITRRFTEQAADVIAVMRAAGQGDTDLRERWQAVEQRRLAGLASLARSLRERGALRPGLTADAATDILWALDSSEVYQQLVGERGWSGDRYERWLAGALAELLLA
jgi:AcrR family transcriptional regulator